MIYDNIKKNLDNIKAVKNSINVNFVNGAFVEIKGSDDGIFNVKFIDTNNNTVVYESNLSPNMWARCNRKYYTKYRIEVYKENELYHAHDYDVNEKRVYISIDSKAIGDTLAWFPVIYEFKKKHKCELVVSTFHNKLFEMQYSDVEFVEPGTTVHNLYAMYNVGLFYNNDGSVNLEKHPDDFKKYSMQQMAAKILGLDLVGDVKPKLKPLDVEQDDKLITIAIHGTAQSKYWNNEQGWQEVIDWLNNKGYTVKLLSRENDGYMGNAHPSGIIKHPAGSLDDVMVEMKRSKMFIGIGSGLSWLSWALGVKTVLISGFSYEWAEMQDCIRIGAPENTCSGCFNEYKLDQGDWNWCPVHKDTDRQFECTKKITGAHVISEISKYL